MTKDILKAAKLLSSIQGKVDPELFTFLSLLTDDITDFKSSLLGISRDESGQLLIYNQPVASAQGDQLVLLMNKLGKIAIRQREPRFPYASLDVGAGRIFCDPPHARYTKSTDTAGTGNYVWADSFNNEPDMFRLVSGGAVVQVTSRGYYRVFCIAQAENSAGGKTLVRVQHTLQGGASSLQQGSHGPLLPASDIFTHMICTEGEMYAGDTYDVALITGATRIGSGGDNRSRLFITRVN